MSDKPTRQLAGDGSPPMARHNLDPRPISAFSDAVGSWSSRPRHVATPTADSRLDVDPASTITSAPRATTWSQAGASTRRPR